MTEEVNETNGLAIDLDDPETRRQLERTYLKCLEILSSLSKDTNPPKPADRADQQKPQRSKALTTPPDYT
jgi:hypothetical protein